jgi:SWI/SNF-related matrix-associated actin-dependent regulator of chromatin subfamily A member 5
VAKCKDNPADLAVKHDAVPDAKIDEEAERKWLSEMERVEASVFEGKKLLKSARYDTNKQAAQEFFNRADRRIGKNTTVMVDGFAISKESMNCAWGEAIPTIAGKDPRLAEPVRAKKPEVVPQDYCQVCIDGGNLHCCRLCPRSYHYGCLDKEYKSKAKGFSFSCPQHKCFDCAQSTAEAGGMLYRCRWCERAYCEDCLDSDNTILIGNSLMEYELLGYPEMSQAFYIQCGGCTDVFKQSPDNKKLCDDLAEGIRLEYEARFTLGRETSTSTRPSSMTDVTTLENTEVNTPVAIDEEMELTPASRKRKARVEIPSSSRSTKRGKL